MTRTLIVTLATLLVVSSCSRPEPPAPTASAGEIEPVRAPVFDRAFWSHWGDGKAELAGYRLTYPRYGEPRPGVAVTIFVTEPFSNSLRVKADPGKHPKSDEFPVMKLNLIQHFQTGIYDYNDMLSSFVALEPVNGRPAGSPAKASFSSQEWCGHVYHQVLFDEQSLRYMMHSYFDGEADQQRQLDYPPDSAAEDFLMLWARGMTTPLLAPGETRSAPLLMSMQSAREKHVPLAWTQATLARSITSQQITVPAGAFEVETWSAELEAGTKRTYYVETAPPHRIIRWETSNGESADLLGIDRLEYWKMNGKGFESALQKLGLSPRPPGST